MKIDCVASMVVYKVYEKSFKDKDGKEQLYYKANCEYDNSCEELSVSKDVVSLIQPLKPNTVKIQVDTIAKTVRIVGVLEGEALRETKKQ